jgi:hypothetical protein
MIVNTHALTIRTPNFMKQTLQYWEKWAMLKAAQDKSSKYTMQPQ